MADAKISLHVFPIKESKSKTKAFVSASLELAAGGRIHLSEMTLVEGSKGLFLGVPSHKSSGPKAKNGYEDTYFFDGAVKKTIEKDAIADYKRQIG